MHCEAVDAAVLANDDTRVDRDDVATRECAGNGVASFLVESCLIVGWHEYGSVDDEEVGIGGW